MPSSATVNRRAAAVVAAALLAAWPAGAQVSPDKKAVAEALFTKARALDEAGKYSEACPLFAESQRIDPGLGTMLWLADCYESNGQIASAWAQFREAQGVAGMRGDARQKVAGARAAALEPKLSKLTVSVPPTAVAPGMEIRRDGVLLTQAEWGLSLPVDPGTHTFEVRAPGHKAWTSTVQVGTTASSASLDVPPLEALPEPPPGLALPASDAFESEQVARRRATQRLVGLVAGGAGVVALGVGGYFSIHAKSTYDASNAPGLCNAQNQCGPAGQQDRNDAQNSATVATVLMGAGAAVLAGGVVLFLTAPRAPARQAKVQVTPIVGFGEAGAGLTGSW